MVRVNHLARALDTHFHNARFPFPVDDREQLVIALATRIRAARRHRSWTQEQLAEALGLSRSAISQWERQSGSRPSSANLEHLARLLQCRFEWLATGNGPREPLGADDASVVVRLQYFARDDAEEQLLAAYRHLDEQGRELIAYLVRLLSGRARNPVREGRRNHLTSK